MAQQIAIENIGLTGVGGQSIPLNVSDLNSAAYRVFTDNNNPIAADKTISFSSGTPIEGITTLQFIIEGGINTSGAAKLKIGGYTVPDSFALNGCVADFEYFQGAYLVRYSVGSNKANTVSGGTLIDGSVPAVKLANDIAGSGMVRNGSGGVSPNLDAPTSSLGIIGGFIKTILNAAGGIVTSVNGLAINLQASTPSLQVVGNQLGVKLDPDGGLDVSAAGLRNLNAPCVCMKESIITLTPSMILNIATTPVVVDLGLTDSYPLPVLVSARKVSGSVVYATDTELVFSIPSGSEFAKLDILGTNGEAKPMVGNISGGSWVNGKFEIYTLDNPTLGDITWEIRILYYLAPNS